MKKFLIWLYTILRIPVPPELLAPLPLPAPIVPVSAPALVPNAERERIDPSWVMLPIDPAIAYPVYKAPDGIRLALDGYAFKSIEALNLYRMIRDHNSARK